ncbi:hypothetical protein MTR67_041091 [Solanum verrucosum]|uniref:Uncharacterized protein n=1 Tax=Solanum verrucosum TaxID=315347 RepID=A0AAF0ULK4_SOLVR|nr:hypothetical protein MTR67_041091 [Solanum verrucosum]
MLMSWTKYKWRKQIEKARVYKCSAEEVPTSM